MKKIFAILVCISLFTALVFGSGGTQGAPAAGPYEFTATFIKNDWHGDPNNMEILKRLERQTNVDEFTRIAQAQIDRLIQFSK